MKLALTAFLAAAVAVTATASADTLTQTHNFSGNVAFNDVATFNQFAGPGTLNYATIEVYLYDNAASYFTGENLGETTATGNYSFGVKGTSTSTTFAGSIKPSADTSGTYSLGAGGTTSVFSSGATGYDSKTFFTTGQKAPFIGAGTFNVDTNVIGYYSISGDSIQANYFPAGATGEVVVTYDYTPSTTPVPLPAALPVGGALLGALALRRFRRA